jgi:hypothetical protein
MSLAQSCDRRQRVQNIAHCAQADDKQTEGGLHVQRSIFAQAVEDERRIKTDQERNCETVERPAPVFGWNRIME